MTVEVNNKKFFVSANGSLTLGYLMYDIKESVQNQLDTICDVWHILPHQLEVKGLIRSNGKPFSILFTLPKTYREEPKWGHLGMPSYSEVIA